MKKYLFYFSIVLSLILLINILSIITLGFNKLTEYDLGYLSGKVILFIFFSTIVFLTRKSLKKI